MLWYNVGSNGVKYRERGGSIRSTDRFGAPCNRVLEMEGVKLWKMNLKIKSLGFKILGVQMGAGVTKR